MLNTDYTSMSLVQKCFLSFLTPEAKAGISLKVLWHLTATGLVHRKDECICQYMDMGTSAFFFKKTLICYKMLGAYRAIKTSSCISDYWESNSVFHFNCILL